MDVEKEPIVVQDSEDEEMPDLEPAPVAEDPDKIKEKGNTAFKAGKFQEAIDQYSRAIGASSSRVAFFGNGKGVRNRLLARSLSFPRA